jgi:predicted CXXCH cytochrome family protein
MNWRKFLFTAGVVLFLSACGQNTSQSADIVSQSFSTQRDMYVISPLQEARIFQPSGCFDNGCHSDFNVNDPVSSHAPFANGECQLCHSDDPHHRPIDETSNAEIALCTSCHSLESLGNSHPIGSGVIDPNTGKALSCVTCHSPHYSNHSHQLILDGSGELCVHCHKEFLSLEY